MSPPRCRVALGLGANLGDPAQSLARAVGWLAEILGPLTLAGQYRSRPLAGGNQPWYRNTVVLARTELPPEALLAILKRLEWVAGRRRGPRHSPRPLDLDLLLHGETVSQLPELTLPHPGLRHRRFVLAPLAEIAPELRIPPDGASVRELLAALDDPADEVTLVT